MKFDKHRHYPWNIYENRCDESPNLTQGAKMSLAGPALAWCMARIF